MDYTNCSMKNTFLLEMQERGYLNQCTDLVKLEDLCGKQKIKAYIVLKLKLALELI